MTIQVDTPRQILVNKLCALLSRNELRDLLDVQALPLGSSDALVRQAVQFREELVDRILASAALLVLAPNVAMVLINLVLALFYFFAIRDEDRMLAERFPGT